MKSKISAVISCLLAVILLAVTVSAEEYTAVSDSIIAYELEKCNAKNVQEWIDTELAENAGISSEWYAISLSQSGNYDFSAYEASLESYLQNNIVRSATSRQKYALALLAVGSNSAYIAETMENSIGEQGLMSYVYGLHLLNNGCTSTAFTAESVTEQILSMQLADGGWAVMGENGDVDVTAMTIQSLVPYYDTEKAVQEAIDSAVQFLSKKQLDNGGYKSMGKEASESISQVISVLSALKIDFETDSRFIKNGNTLFSALDSFRFSDGSYCHEIGGESNHTATVQAFMAVTSYNSMKNGNGNLYVFANEISEETVSETTATETEIAEETTEITENHNNVETEKSSYKPVACAVIVVLAAAVCVILWVTKKRNGKNFIAVAIVSAIAIAVVICTEFSSAKDYYGTVSEKENPVGTVTLEICCDTVAGKADYIPESGVILEQTEFAFEKGETVYDILVEACRENEIQTEFSNGYISGMNYIYEFDFGELSGWLYFVNDEEASVGCDSYELADGDEIKWVYSCEMGNDLK